MVLLGVVGLAIELVLIEHWGSALEWLPLGALGLGLLGTVGVWARPSVRVVRAFQIVMGAFVALGAVGLWLHYRGNALLELELDAAAGGWTLFRRAAFGGIPFLAPGALAQTGLIGLAATFRHPALKRAANRSIPTRGE